MKGNLLAMGKKFGHLRFRHRQDPLWALGWAHLRLFVLQRPNMAVSRITLHVNSLCDDILVSICNCLKVQRWIKDREYETPSGPGQLQH